MGMSRWSTMWSLKIFGIRTSAGANVASTNHAHPTAQ
jgi:hypothetical protein